MERFACIEVHGGCSGFNLFFVARTFCIQCELTGKHVAEARDPAAKTAGVKHSQKFHGWLADTLQSESTNPEAT